MASGMEIFILVLMLVVAHFGALVALLAVAKNRTAGRFYLLSLIGVWAGYFAYEAFVVDCSSRCNIRPDLFVVYPYLILVSAMSIGGLRRNFFEEGVSPVAPAAVESRTSDGTTELMGAAAIGDLQGIERLLAGGADIDARDERGWTALMFSALRDELGAVDLLLRKGADPARRNNDRLTAGDIARRHGNAEVAGLLDNAKGPPHAQERNA